MDLIIWIIIGVVAVVVLVALIALATRANTRKKLAAATELRKDARARERLLERQDSVAREQEHRAGAAEEEARAKAEEAERLRAEADEHRATVDEQRRDVRRMKQHAGELDPRHRAGDDGREADHAEAGRAEAPGPDRGGRHSAPDGYPGSVDGPGGDRAVDRDDPPRRRS